jgi:hypothetical protein
MLIAGAAVAAVLGGAGFAFASFHQTHDANVAGGTERFAPVLVSGLVKNTRLLPGESTEVTLTLTNPQGNTVKAQISQVTTAGVVVDPASLNGNSALATTCATFFKQADVKDASKFPLIDAGSSFTYPLADGVQLKGTAPVDCQGMTFTAKWSVDFEPVR